MGPHVPEQAFVLRSAYNDRCITCTPNDARLILTEGGKKEEGKGGFFTSRLRSNSKIKSVSNSDSIGPQANVTVRDGWLTGYDSIFQLQLAGPLFSSMGFPTCFQL